MRPGFGAFVIVSGRGGYIDASATQPDRTRVWRVQFWDGGEGWFDAGCVGLIYPTATSRKSP